ncbi:hypothetical protein [Arthrobacter sp.]|uniref:hypothetical protein n=1 Tax=Arthrobacter sp. TaxID=1667 RepID=UPI003A8CF27D
MTENPQFQESMLLALNASNPREVISGVKEVVAGKLQELDDRVEVSFTDYFNHSYMPDMVLAWREGSRKHERPVFVRTDVSPSGIAADIHGLIPQAPMIIAVDEQSAGHTAREAISEEKRHRQVDLLMTDSRSISAITAEQADEPKGYDFSRLVTNNFLSGARGFIGEPEAQRLQKVFILETEDELAEAGFTEVVNDFFMPDAAVRLTRSTQLVRDVLSGKLDSLSLSGQFSQTELRTLLPLLLGNETARQNKALWSQLGEVMSLPDLFEVSEELAFLELSPLLNANLHRWSAKRAQVAAVVHTDEEDADSALRANRWSIWRGLLALTTEHWRVLFADDARKLKGRSAGGTIPSWSEVSSVLKHFNVDSVELHGIDRRVTLASQEGGDIYRDTDAVAGALEEAFYVPRLTLRSNAEPRDVSSLVEFSEMLITSSTADSLSNLSKAAFNLLLHNVAKEDFTFADDLRSEFLIDEQDLDQ